MAIRKFEGYKRSTVTVQDYMGWLNDIHTPCSESDNKAFLSSNASRGDIEAAKNMCASCPFQAGCNFFAHTKVFSDFDGVMGGELFTDGSDDDITIADDDNIFV